MENRSHPKKTMVTYSRYEAREKINQIREARKYSETREDSSNMEVGEKVGLEESGRHLGSIC